ncbi:sigma-70 family RNA polymerase sigma factor [Chryseobacterium sp. 22543]|uniref:sigma-70 family RNA polymerase sigma factor n=1 Tax=Chryseobacterium sp. 22543 TaxID=3453940 RepID=UPI003F82775F
MREDSFEIQPLDAQETDLRAFKMLYEKYRKALLVYAMKYIKDESVCLELVQDAFIYLWEKRLDVKDQNIGSYLYLFIKSRSLNYLRDNIRYIDLSNSKERVEHPDYELSEQADSSNLLKEALANIPAKVTRRVLELRFLHEMSYKEIAQAMSISLNATYVHVNAGLKILRKRFKK